MPAYLYLKGLNVEVVHAQQGDGVVDVEAQGEGAHKVGALLDRAVVGGGLGGAQLDGLALHVHAALQLEVLDQRRVDLGPRGLERRHAVGRDGHLAVLDAHGVAPRRGRGEARAALLVHGVVELHVCLGGLLGLLRLCWCCVWGVEEDVFVLGFGWEGDVGCWLLRGSLEGCWRRHDDNVCASGA